MRNSGHRKWRGLSVKENGDWIEPRRVECGASQTALSLSHASHDSISFDSARDALRGVGAVGPAPRSSFGGGRRSRKTQAAPGAPRGEAGGRDDVSARGTAKVVTGRVRCARRPGRTGSKSIRDFSGQRSREGAGPGQLVAGVQAHPMEACFHGGSLGPVGGFGRNRPRKMMKICFLRQPKGRACVSSRAEANGAPRPLFAGCSFLLIHLRRGGLAPHVHEVAPESSKGFGDSHPLRLIGE